MEDFEYFKGVRAQFKILKAAGLWQVGESTWKYKMWGIFLYIFGLGIFLYGQLVFAINGSSLKESADALSLLCTYILLTAKSTMFIFNADAAVALYEELKDLIFLAEKKIGKPLKNIEGRFYQTEIIFKLYWGICLVTTTFGGFFPIITYFSDPNPPYKVPYRTWFPLDYENSFEWFIFVAVYEYVNTSFYCGVVVALDMLPVFFLNAATGFLEELAVHLGNIGGNNGDGKNIKDDNFNILLDCIDIHLKTKALITRTEKIFSPMIFSQGAASLIIICTTAFTLSQIPSGDWTSVMRLILYMIPMVMQILIICYFGNEVSIFSLELSTSLFHSEWYNESSDFKTGMKMLIENNKNPIQVVAAEGLFQVHLGAFLRICNSAYSMYAVLQRMKN